MRSGHRGMVGKMGLAVVGLAGTLFLAPTAFAAPAIPSATPSATPLATGPATTLASSGAHRLPAVTVSAPASPVIVASAVEPHPEIMAAIRSLERAKNHLEHAAHDFGGHRVEAIAAIDAALQQLRQALAFDR